jgi:hypothetical protein
MYLCMFAFMYVCIYVCMYLCIHVCMHSCMDVCSSTMRKRPVMYVFTSEGVLFDDQHSPSSEAAVAVVCSLQCVVCSV